MLALLIKYELISILLSAEKDVVDLGKEIERLEWQAAIDAELNKPTSNLITNRPSGNPDGEEKAGRASDKYRKTFWNAMRRKKFYDVENALQVGTDSEGGYLVPDEFEHTLVEALEEENFFRSIATVIQTSSGDRKIPVAATKGTASWIDEEAKQYLRVDSSDEDTFISGLIESRGDYVCGHGTDGKNRD